MADRETRVLLDAIHGYESAHGGDAGYQKICDTLKEAITEISAQSPHETSSPGQDAAKSAAQPSQDVPVPKDTTANGSTTSDAGQPPAGEHSSAPATFADAKGKAKDRMAAINAARKKHG